jgi:hypothetical protein
MLDVVTRVVAASVDAELMAAAADTACSVEEETY